VLADGESKLQIKDCCFTQAAGVVWWIFNGRLLYPHIV
jgi:hypothetical protein